MANQTAPGTKLAVQTETKFDRPPLYKVLLLNDDFTPMDFVIDVLGRYFHKGEEEAAHIMMTVHEKGVGVCGIYAFEIAETKVKQVLDYARVHNHPLQCALERN